MTRSAVTTEKTLRKQEKRRQRRRVNADLREQYSGDLHLAPAKSLFQNNHCRDIDMPFTQSDFESAASQLGCSWQAVAAVCQVESRGGGFCPDGFPKTLHEGHHFHRYTKGKFGQSHPTISYPTWTKVHYGKTWEEERARLDVAMKLDRTSAIMSNSWGAFQIMGANYAACGCRTLQEFVNGMCKSEAEQLAMFVEYIKFHRLDDELRELRFKDFARLYNGPGQVDTYGGRMSAAYKKLVP